MPYDPLDESVSIEERILRALLGKYEITKNYLQSINLLLVVITFIELYKALK